MRGQPIDCVALAHSEVSLNILLNYASVLKDFDEKNREAYERALDEVHEAVLTLDADINLHRTTSDYRCIYYEAR